MSPIARSMPTLQGHTDITPSHTGTSGTSGVGDRSFNFPSYQHIINSVDIITVQRHSYNHIIYPTWGGVGERGEGEGWGRGVGVGERGGGEGWGRGRGRGVEMCDRKIHKVNKILSI